VWEALLLSRVVVTVASSLAPLWVGLPVVALSSWDELSRGRVVSAIEELSTPAALALSRASTEKLFFPYYACMIGTSAQRQGEFCSTAALLSALSNMTA
jgi:hypothetical protein